MEADHSALEQPLDPGMAGQPLLGQVWVKVVYKQNVLFQVLQVRVLNGGANRLRQGR